MAETPTNASIEAHTIYFDPHEWMHIQKIQMKIVSPNSPRLSADTLDVCSTAQNYHRRDKIINRNIRKYSQQNLQSWKSNQI